VSPPSPPIRLSIETAAKKSFATAVDWPGWSRSGKTEELATAALAAYAKRYSIVASLAGDAFPAPGTGSLGFEIVERTSGGGATDYGVPGNVTEQDRRPVDAKSAGRLARLVEAAWRTFDTVVEAAPAELRKGPRGGGRDTARMVDHVFGAEQAYAANMGIKTKAFDTTDRAALDALRAAMLVVLRVSSDGSPIAGRRWTTRYAAHRIAWHALDHAWEIEDKTDQPA
jgi:hypothetical protein